MNAVEFLKSQHKEAKAGFQKIEQASESQRGALWKHLSPELKLHEQMEEKHLYGPVAKDAEDPGLVSWPDRHAAEVREAEQLIAGIDRGSPADREWLQDVKRLHAALEAHIKEEEGKIWPKIEQVWSRSRLRGGGEEDGGHEGREEVGLIGLCRCSRARASWTSITSTRSSWWTTIQTPAGPSRNCCDWTATRWPRQPTGRRRWIVCEPAAVPASCCSTSTCRARRDGGFAPCSSGTARSPTSRSSPVRAMVDWSSGHRLRSWTAGSEASRLRQAARHRRENLSRSRLSSGPMAARTTRRTKLSRRRPRCDRRIDRIALLCGPTLALAADAGQLERGRYIAHDVAMCVQCHTPRDASGALIEGQEFMGGAVSRGATRMHAPGRLVRLDSENRGPSGIHRSGGGRVLHERRPSRPPPAEVAHAPLPHEPHGRGGRRGLPPLATRVEEMMLKGASHTPPATTSRRRARRGAGRAALTRRHRPRVEAPGQRIRPAGGHGTVDRRYRRGHL